MKLPTPDRLSNVTNLLERDELRLSADSIDRIRRLVEFTEYSLQFETDGQIAETFIDLAEQVIAKRA